MLISFFKKISDYFDGQSLPDGSLTCKKHNIEHTGKNAYSIIVDLELFKITKDSEYFLRAKKRALRIVENLIKDPDFDHWIFWPGRLDGRNMSNSVIDSGACSDALSSFYIECENLLIEEEKNKIKDAIFKNCDTYLKHACVGKEITNQRLWGATGIARAYNIFKEESWKEAVIKSIEGSFLEMFDDGTFPYHSQYKEYGIYEGIFDTTTFYHSRHIAFIVYALENIGVDPENYKEKLKKSADFLIGMYQEDGIKNINLETKRWYFLSNYEVASNAYDVFVFIKIYNFTNKKIYIEYAQKALKQLIDHQLSDGGVSTNHGSQDNFQCRIFWTANCSWLAKIYKELAFFEEDKKIEGTRSSLFFYFENSDIVKFRNNNYACILRGKKQPQNVAWGPRVGGGSLLYFGLKNSGFHNNLLFHEWSNRDPLNFYLKLKRGSGIISFIKKNKKDLKALLYYIKVEIKAKNLRAVFMRVSDFMRKISTNNTIAASHFSCDVDTKIADDRKSIVFVVSPSTRNGDTIDGVFIERKYVFKDFNLLVSETLLIKSNKRVEKVTYIKNKFMKDIEIFSDRAFQERENKIIFNGNASIIKISYSL